MPNVPEPVVLDLGDARLAVRSWGPRDGPAVLYLHHLGVAGSSLQPHETVSALAARGYRVVAPDQPGFGESPPLPPERYLLDELAALDLGVLDALGIERAALVGFSWGASVAVHLAGRAPQRVAAVALLDAGHVDSPESNTLEEQQAQAREVVHDHFTFDSVDAAVQAMQEQARRWSAHMETSWRTSFSERDGKAVPALAPETFAAAAWGYQQRPPSAAWPALGASAIPVIQLLAGQPAERLADQRAASAAFAAAVPRAQLRWMQGNGHNLVAELGEPLGAELADWLASVGWG
jgi:pimeloyl-ACP methyl ester carboxylesterase